MSETIEFTPKYRDHPIEVAEHDHDGICSVDVGGAILHGDPVVSTGAHPAFEVWDDGNLILHEYLSEGDVREVSEGIEEVK